MLVAIEGIDGSGKGTQAQRLEARAVRDGCTARSFSFPRYGANPFALAISQYLNGGFGTTKSISPYLSAALYAGDRFCARSELLLAVRQSDLVVCDRYVDSNIAHQAAKLDGPVRSEFIAWIEEVEYNSYALPRPDLTILLAVPVHVAVKLIARKSARAYTALAADFHESDESYLKECAGVYLSLADRNRASTRVVRCVDSSGLLRTEDSIGDEVWEIVRGGLAVRREQAVPEERNKVTE